MPGFGFRGCRQGFFGQEAHVFTETDAVRARAAIQRDRDGGIVAGEIVVPSQTEDRQAAVEGAVVVNPLDFVGGVGGGILGCKLF